MALRTVGGRLEVICGSMFSGKTEELIRRVKRAQIARQRVQTFKPALDDRYAGKASVSSHGGAQMEAVPVEEPGHILDLVEPRTEVVAIDEVQFFDASIVEIVQRLADSGKRVIVAGLDTDFRGEPFGAMPVLMATAEHVDKLQAICVVCGHAASRTQRMIDGQPASYQDPVIVVGATELYEARCRRCHEVRNRP